jgi:hypothetical protein
VNLGIGVSGGSRLSWGWVWTGEGFDEALGVGVGVDVGDVGDGLVTA